MKRLSVIIAMAAALAVSPAANAKKKPAQTWVVNRISDPITGLTRCIVSAPDRAAGIRFTRFGALYPVVELNSEYGLLVGVSSGGNVRMPTGDILWRVDDRPFRELKAVDNPAGQSSSVLPESAKAQVGAAATESMTRMISAVSATSTVANGGKAKVMLAEMVASQGLLFRSAAVQQFGLADPHVVEVGQATGKGLAPIPLDESFKAGLVACGISVEPVTHE